MHAPAPGSVIAISVHMCLQSTKRALHPAICVEGFANRGQGYLVRWPGVFDPAWVHIWGASVLQVTTGRVSRRVRVGVYL